MTERRDRGQHDTNTTGQASRQTARRADRPTSAAIRIKAERETTRGKQAQGNKAGGKKSERRTDSTPQSPDAPPIVS